LRIVFESRHGDLGPAGSERRLRQTFNGRIGHHAGGILTPELGKFLQGGIVCAHCPIRLCPPVERIISEERISQSLVQPFACGLVIPVDEIVVAQRQRGAGAIGLFGMLRSKLREAFVTLGTGFIVQRAG